MSIPKKLLLSIWQLLEGTLLVFEYIVLSPYYLVLGIRRIFTLGVAGVFWEISVVLLKLGNATQHVGDTVAGSNVHHSVHLERS